MKTVRIAKRFLQKFAHAIIACLSCYDRMIFKGYLQIGGDEQLNGWVDGVLEIPRKDFTPQLVDFSQQLVEYSKKLAQESGAHWEHLQGKIRKEKLVDDIAQVYVNGHDWLARQMAQRGLGFVQEDNTHGCWTMPS